MLLDGLPQEECPCHTFYKKYFLSAVEKNN